MSKIIRFVARATLITANVFFWLFFVITSTVLFIGAVVIRVITGPFDLNLKILHQYSCFWASLYIWVNPFWSLKKKGLENVDPKKTYVIVSNHQSITDILLLFNTFIHFKWVSKKSMFKTPLLGWNMRLNGYVPIERGDATSREKCMNLCREWLAKGSSVFFFPEGTRSKDGALLPFKIGAFRLAVEMKRDVLPIVVRGSLNIIPKHSKLLSGKSVMTLEVLSPISIDAYQGMESAEKLMNDVHQSMLNKL